MKIIFYSISAFALLISCKKENLPEPPDLTKPSLEIISSVPAYAVEGDEKVVEIAPGASVTVNVKLKDNTNLKQIKYDIHDASDGHTHIARTEAVTIWSDSKIINISGKEATQTQTFTAPADAKLTEYHLEMIVIDASGNESIEYILAVEVK